MFNKYAKFLEETYGVQYDKEERFVICPECGEPLYECDWEPQTFEIVDGNWYCPVCDQYYDTEDED